jgi:pimeloyl-ACP methyl ester carboxylesterase
MSMRCFPTRGSRGTAVIVPPWKLPRAGVLRGWIALARRAGLDAWLLSPPHHLERTAPGARGGEGFLSPDLGRVRAAFEQLVLEIRLALALAAPRGEVALVGLSLGGLGAALAATAPERIDRALLVAPADLARALGETPIGRRYRRLADAAGAPIPDGAALDAALRPLDPGSRRPTAREILIAAGAFDAVAPPEGARALARAWGAPARTYPRGHLTLLFGCRALRRDAHGFLRG